MSDDGMKLCCRCRALKPLDQFYRCVGTKDGKQVRCIPCQKIVQKKYTQSAKGKIQSLRYSLGRYSITPEQYEELLRGQGNKCAICGITQSNAKGDRRWHVDHDHQCCKGQHSCGRCVRGLLCHGCNVHLAWLENHDSKIRNYLVGPS